MHPKLRHSHTHTKNSAALLLSFFPHLHIAPPCPTLFSSKLLDLICKVFHLGHDDTEDLQTLSQGEPAATYDTAPSLGPTPTPAAIVVNALAAVILSLLFFLSVQSFRFWFRTYTLAGQPTVSRKWSVQPYPPLPNSLLIFCSLHTTRNTFYELSKHSRRRVAKVFACVTSLNKHYASGSASKIYKKNGMNKKHVVVLNTQTHGLPQEADKTGSKIKTLL